MTILFVVRRLLVLFVVLAVVGAACTSDDSSDDPGASDGDDQQQQAETPPGDPPQTIDRADVDRAVEEIQPLIEEAMADTGVPGLAIGVVFDDEVVWTEGFGVREVSTEEAVDADTVFQLASMSKPLGSTVVAALVGDGVVAWDDPVTRSDPGFVLSDPWVTEHVTFADLYSHRSGLPDHAGDLLEDLGYDRAQVLERLRFEPLDPFRISYAYTNFGLTAAATIAAGAAGLSWEDASREELYEPLAMSSTSSTFADYMAQPNRAIPHVEEPDGTWVAKYQRDPDAQSPAGGASSSVNDMVKWLRLQLAGGTYEGEDVVDADALAQTHVPQITSSPPRTPSARTGFYGLGWNVSYDDHGYTRWGHSGAFALGAATAVTLVPGQSLGVVVLTNGWPVGVPEAIAESFVDLATEGDVTRDWVNLYAQAFEPLTHPEPTADRSTPPADPAPAQPDDAYVGVYANDFYGPAEVRATDAGLVLVLGPDQLTFELTHYDGDTFVFTPTGENAVPESGAIFEVGSDGTATSLTVEWLDEDGLGTFART